MSRNLVVVDVQLMFSGYFNQEYLQNVQSFVENNPWDNIIVIYNEKEFKDEEETLEYIPDWLSKTSTHVIRKSIVTCLYDNYIRDLLTYGYKEEQSNLSWRKGDSLILKTPTDHELFFVPKDLQTIGKSIKECTLIGGASGYCLEDIKVSLEYFGVKTSVKNLYTYSLGEWKGELRAVKWVSVKEKASQNIQPIDSNEAVSKK